jgi:hypothetical protein
MKKSELKQIIKEEISKFNINEGVWSVGNPDDIKLFIKKIEELKDDFHNVVGSDDVFNGLDAAQRGAEELLKMDIRNKA